MPNLVAWENSCNQQLKQLRNKGLNYNRSVKN